MRRRTINTRLWYDKPADEYMSGLPIGTGRLAAMVLGAVQPERVALNHEWLWRGIQRARDVEPAADRLAKVRHNQQGRWYGSLDGCTDNPLPVLWHLAKLVGRNSGADGCFNGPANRQKRNLNRTSKA